MSVRFGTDGVRGVANSEITAEIALAIGRATALVFPSPRVVIGRDTRRSGPMLEAAVAAGVASQGADAVTLGVVPTPAVALISARDRVPGVVISASHNSFEDNGIKVFAPGGLKLSDAEQARVEASVAAALRDTPTGITGGAVGTLVDDSTAVGAYLGTARVIARGTRPGRPGGRGRLRQRRQLGDRPSGAPRARCAPDGAPRRS